MLHWLMIAVVFQIVRGEEEYFLVQELKCSFRDGRCGVVAHDESLTKLAILVSGSSEESEL